MWRLCLFVVLALSVAGCVTPEQRQARIAAHMQRDLAPLCTAAGFTPGTDPHSQCVLTLYKQELERNAAIAASAVSSGAQARQQVSCYTWGNVTNCY
jgi:hypothetical protein